MVSGSQITDLIAMGTLFNAAAHNWQNTVTAGRHIGSQRLATDHLFESLTVGKWFNTSQATIISDTVKANDVDVTPQLVSSLPLHWFSSS